MLDTGLRFDPAGSAIQTGYEDRMERLYKKLEAYGQEGSYPFHMPGHKRNKEYVYGDFPIEQDITEIYGFTMQKGSLKKHRKNWPGFTK